MEIKVYLAAAFQEQQRMKFIREHIKRAGITVTSRWLDVEAKHHDEIPSDDERAEWAEKDLQDVAACNLFVLYNPIGWHNKGTGGRHVETGYAIAIGKPILYVGDVRENLFHYHRNIIARVAGGEDLIKPIQKAWNIYSNQTQSEK